MESRIFFIHKNKAHLPEIEAYSSFFSSYNYNTFVVSYKDLFKLDKDILKKSILWYFMGFYPRKIDGKFIIHDYRSLSIGKFAKVKDYIKKVFNFKPNLRIFLNEAVKNRLSFNDDIPCITIDMGLPSSIIRFVNLNLEPKYDFIYVGTISYEREIHRVIERFIGRYGKKKNLLLVGLFEEGLKRKYSIFQNIIFMGKVSQEDVFKFIKESRYAICIIPNKYPYNLQTPTKLLEYLALRSKIIANKNPLILDILKETNNIDKVFIMDENWNFPKEDELIGIKQSSIYFEELLWENILKRSNIIEVIRNVLRE